MTSSSACSSAQGGDRDAGDGTSPDTASALSVLLAAVSSSLVDKWRADRAAEPEPGRARVGRVHDQHGGERLQRCDFPPLLVTSSQDARTSAAYNAPAGCGQSTSSGSLGK